MNSADLSTSDLLRIAADATDKCALGERKERALKLLALHIVRACGSGENAQEARLLLELLGD